MRDEEVHIFRNGISQKPNKTKPQPPISFSTLTNLNIKITNKAEAQLSCSYEYVL